MKRLVNEGENGTATYKTPVSTINTSGNLQLSGNYYIQNYRNDNKRTLIDLGEQPYILDKTKIKTPKNFKVDFRNFF